MVSQPSQDLPIRVLFWAVEKKIYIVCLGSVGICIIVKILSIRCIVEPTVGNCNRSEARHDATSVNDMKILQKGPPLIMWHGVGSYQTAITKRMLTRHESMFFKNEIHTLLPCNPGVPVFGIRLFCKRNNLTLRITSQRNYTVGVNYLSTLSSYWYDIEQL